MERWSAKGFREAMDYYKKNWIAVHKKYFGKWIIIYDGAIQCHSENVTDVVAETAPQRDLGDFLLKYVEPITSIPGIREPQAPTVKKHTVGGITWLTFNYNAAFLPREELESALEENARNDFADVANLLSGENKDE